MKKKSKQIITVLFVVFAMIFLVIVKVLKLTFPEIMLSIVFISFLKDVLENFLNGEALLTKLSIIT